MGEGASLDRARRRVSPPDLAQDARPAVPDCLLSSPSRCDSLELCKSVRSRVGGDDSSRREPGVGREGLEELDRLVKVGNHLFL